MDIAFVKMYLSNPYHYFHILQVSLQLHFIELRTQYLVGSLF